MNDLIHQIYEAERLAWSNALEQPEFVAELTLWEETLTDGID